MNVGDISDEALMLRYQRGDRSAFSLLVRRHQVAVYNFLLRELGSALSADELAQEVFLGVVREGGRYNYETPFSTRLFSIACRLVQRERARRPARNAARLRRGARHWKTRSSTPSTGCPTPRRTSSC